MRCCIRPEKNEVPPTITHNPVYDHQRVTRSPALMDVRSVIYQHPEDAPQKPNSILLERYLTSEEKLKLNLQDKV